MGLAVAEAPVSGEITQQVEAFKRRVYERIGAWIAEHWTQLASAFGGALVGAVSVYGLFAAQVHNASKAAADAMAASTALAGDVKSLNATVAQLVTARELEAAVLRIKELEDWKCYAQAYRGHAPPQGCAPQPGPVK